MLKLVRRVAVLIALPFAAAGALSTMSAAPAQAAVPSSYTTQVVQLTNVQRVKAGCPRVRINLALTRAAAMHSRDMVQRNYFDHTSPSGGTFISRAKHFGYNYAIGENIAWGHQTPSAVVSAWMKSPGHRSVMLSCKVRSIGVGVATTSKGVPYWTQVFGRV